MPRLLLLPILFCLLGLAPATRPAAPEVETIAPGITIEHFSRHDARPIVGYLVRLDPTAGLRFVTTADNGQLPEETTLETTRNFLERTGATLAINTTFFRLPHTLLGQPLPYADNIGLLVSDGEIVSPTGDRQPAFVIDEAGRASLLADRPVDGSVRHAAAGSGVILRNGQIIAKPGGAIHPRTAVGATEDDTILFLIVDGRQPGRSEGVTLHELAGLLADAGADWALNLDGGGSSTLVVRDHDTSRGRVVNVPVGIHDRPGTERPVGANLGVTVPAPEEAEGAAEGRGQER